MGYVKRVGKGSLALFKRFKREGQGRCPCWSELCGTTVRADFVCA